MRRFKSPLLLVVLACLVVAGWWWPNRAVDPGEAGAETFNCLSYEGYRPGESPLVDRFPTEAEMDQDLGLLAGRTRAIRTYAAIEGPTEIPALAHKHGLKVWQGIWLGGDRAHNALEMARAIDMAHRYPDTIERVVVGNEVLLRRDLPVSELIADIDHVKALVRQPVAYADVSHFWEQFPEVAPHVDYALIHLLPYWEDTPTSVDHAVIYIGQVYERFRALFPHTHIVIGETGWPSRGRQRRDAVPGRVAETRFLRGFMALSREKKFDYNFIEAFDQHWKYQNEGVMGANWGLFSANRVQKIPASGPIEEDPLWREHAALSVVCGLLLAGLARAAGGTPAVRHRLIFPSACLVFAMALGAALGVAQADASPVLYDFHVRLAAVVNLAGQALLAALMMLRLCGAVAGVPARCGADATRRVQGVFRLRVPSWDGLFEDLCFVFVWGAMVVEALLVFDPRYRVFPVASFAVPLVVTVVRAWTGDLPDWGGGREELFAGVALVGCAIGSAVQEGALNGQSLVWNGCAVILAVPLLRRFRRRAPASSGRA